jgi:hypothetical protein
MTEALQSNPRHDAMKTANYYTILEFDLNLLKG